MAFPKSQKQAAYLQSDAGKKKLSKDDQDDVDQRVRGEELPPYEMHDKPYTGGRKKAMPGNVKNRIAVRRALK